MEFETKGDCVYVCHRKREIKRDTAKQANIQIEQLNSHIGSSIEKEKRERERERLIEIGKGI
jgi:hypothetical protein